MQGRDITTPSHDRTNLLTSCMAAPVTRQPSIARRRSSACSQVACRCCAQHLIAEHRIAEHLIASTF
jgi:hypothetical protein